MDPNSNYRSLGPIESRLVLGLTEEGRRELTRQEAMTRFSLTENTVNEVLTSLVRKGWLARAGRGKYLLIPPDWGATPISESNTLALAAQLTADGYIAFSTAAAHWGLTTQVRNVVWIVTRTHARPRRINDSDIRFARLPAKALFGFAKHDRHGDEHAIGVIDARMAQFFSNESEWHGGSLNLDGDVHAGRRLSFFSSSTVLAVGSRMSSRRLWVRCSKVSCDFLSQCGERSTVNRSTRVGSGIGPATLAPVRLTVSTMSCAETSMTR